MLKATERALSAEYDLAMLDLDGVVYIGGHAVPGAAESIAAARDHGMKVAFVTNNAARPPAAVAEHLRELEIGAEAQDVVNSAQAAAGVLCERYGAGARVAMLGAVGLSEALWDAGLVPVPVDDQEAVAVVTGYGPDVVWRDVMRVASRIRAGLPWVASNTDASLPTPYGVAPGHGVMVDMIARFAHVRPTVAGKPEPPLLTETIRRVGGERPLMVGDRLDTDIAGGTAIGVDTLLVMTGVTDLEALAHATPDLRPTYIAADLGGLLEPQPRVEVGEDRCAVGGWDVSIDGDGAVQAQGTGATDDWWRAVAALCWSRGDTTGNAPDVSRLSPPR